LSKIFNPTNFENLLDKLTNLTSTTIFDTIYKYDLPVWDIRLEEIENDKKLPIFITSFYDFILKFKYIPTSDEFFIYYKEYNKDFFMRHHYSVYLMIGLQARCYRLYPSLVRELHFIKVVSECLNKDKYTIIYNLKLDIYEGIDMMIINKGIDGSYTSNQVKTDLADIKHNNDKYFGINLFVDTYYSKEGRKSKKNRHEAYDNVTYVDLPITISGRYDNIKCDNFVLYGYNSYHELLNKISLN